MRGGPGVGHGLHAQPHVRPRLIRIAPGAIVTPIDTFVLDDPEAEHAVEDEIPLGHIGKPEDIAAPVVWARPAT